MPPVAQHSGGLAGILKVLALVVIAYFAVTEGWPWLREELKQGRGAGGGGEQSFGGDGGRCVDLAAEASAALGEQIHRFRQPPYDLAAWGSAVAAVEERASRAETVCTCPLESCQTAAAALTELRDLLGAVDSVIRGDPTAFRNPARQQERIDDLLAQARDAARDGR
jgi:hypothetical protein